MLTYHPWLLIFDLYIIHHLYSFSSYTHFLPWVLIKQFSCLVHGPSHFTPASSFPTPLDPHFPPLVPHSPTLVLNSPPLVPQFPPLVPHLPSQVPHFPLLVSHISPLFMHVPPLVPHFHHWPLTFHPWLLIPAPQLSTHSVNSHPLSLTSPLWSHNFHWTDLYLLPFPDESQDLHSNER